MKHGHKGELLSKFSCFQSHISHFLYYLIFSFMLRKSERCSHHILKLSFYPSCFKVFRLMDVLFPVFCDFLVCLLIFHSKVFLQLIIKTFNLLSSLCFSWFGVSLQGFAPVQLQKHHRGRGQDSLQTRSSWKSVCFLDLPACRSALCQVSFRND